MNNQEQMIKIFVTAQELSNNALVAFHKAESTVWRDWAEKQMQVMKQAIAEYEKAKTNGK